MSRRTCILILMGARKREGIPSSREGAGSPSDPGGEALESFGAREKRAVLDLFDEEKHRSGEEVASAVQRLVATTALTFSDVAHILLDAGKGRVAKVIPELRDLDISVVRRLIGGGMGGLVLRHLDRFDVDHNEVITEILVADRGLSVHLRDVDRYFRNFSGLTAKTMEKLLDANEEIRFVICESLGSFADLTPETAKKLVDTLLTGSHCPFGMILNVHRHVTGSTESIRSLDREKAALPVLASTKYLEACVLFLGNEEANGLFPLFFEEARERIFASLELDEALALAFVDNLHRYDEELWCEDMLLPAVANHYVVAKEFLEKEGTLEEKNWSAGIHAVAEKKVTDFEKDDGFHESDPYERHPWRLTEEQAKAASVFSKLLAGDAVDEEVLRELGIDRGQIGPLLERVNGKIETAHQKFLEKVRTPLEWRNNLRLTDDQREEILNPPVRLRPLPDVIRSLVARYLVQMAQGFGALTSDTLIDGLDSLLDKGFRSYVQAYTVDIPLYDKLYDEYDNLRDAGRYPLEVYVGRDGIYAWIGRRVQDVARRRKMGREKRMEMKEKGEILEINPKYVVYPRYFRDNMKYEVKRQLLEQEGVSPDADPLFYDTGYTGTILEQMMRIMEFDEEEIDRRMRLLSAKTASRRVRGIPDNRRNDVVERIEDSAKPEETAEGLMIDEKTGKIRHIAKPVPPDQFFDFMMIKQAISRHYWTKDHLHREQSGNANFDSERHTIRIREEYKDALPEELFVNPDGFLDEQAVPWRGFRGGRSARGVMRGVMMLTTRDGRDIVVETVQPKKMKEVQQEFSVLVAAKKAGLPVAAPVGIISEKGGGGGYVLVEKLEGHHGRNFEKWLQNSGSFSEEKVREIMSDVRNRHRSVAKQFKEKIDVSIDGLYADNFIVDFDEEAGEVRSVTPVNWM